jgi:hypothetical protein
VRLTGLRIYGPYAEIPHSACDPEAGCRLTAVSIEGQLGEDRAVEIDNNEMFAWAGEHHRGHGGGRVDSKKLPSGEGFSAVRNSDFDAALIQASI